MVTFLLIAALIILLCLICNRFSDRFGVPSLLLFIGLGLLFGADGPIRVHFDNYALSESICSPNERCCWRMVAMRTLRSMTMSSPLPALP